QRIVRIGVQTVVARTGQHELHAVPKAHGDEEGSELVVDPGTPHLHAGRLAHRCPEAVPDGAAEQAVAVLPRQRVVVRLPSLSGHFGRRRESDLAALQTATNL